MTTPNPGNKGVRMDTKIKPANNFNRREVLKTLSTAAGGTAAWVAAPAVVRAQARPIKIGLVTPTTGPLAFFAEADNYVLGEFKKAIGSGLSIAGQTHPVEVIVKDSQSNSNRAAEVANELILGSKIDLMVVAHTPDTVNPVADQCEVNEVPCISTDAPWQPYFFGRHGDPAKGFKWTYHFFWGAGDLINVFIGMWDQLQTNKSPARYGRTIPTATPSPIPSAACRR